MAAGTDDEGTKKRFWLVDPSIWSPGPAAGRLKRITVQITGLVAPFIFGGMVIVGPLSVLLSLAIIYPLVPHQFFGLTLVSFWSIMIVAFIVIAEKTGYARNFQDWNLPLKRIIVIPIAFLLVLGVILLLFLVAHPATL